MPVPHAYPELAFTGICSQIPPLFTVQRGEATIASASAVAIKTLAKPVDADYSTPHLDGWRAAGGTLNTTRDFMAVSSLTDTQLTLQTTSTGQDRICAYQVAHWAKWAVKSIQRGFATISSGNSVSQVINAVDLANSVVFHNGHIHTTNNADFNYCKGRVDLVDSTHVRGRKDTGTNPNLLIGFCVIEFWPGILESIQEIEINIAGSSATGDQSISAVDNDDAFLFFGGWTISAFASGLANRMPYAHRTSTTNVRATRGTAGSSTTIQVNATVVHFKKKFIGGRQAGQCVIANSASSDTDAPVAVDESLTLMLQGGHASSSGATHAPSADYATLRLTAPNEVKAERGGTPATSVTAAWELLQCRST